MDLTSGLYTGYVCKSGFVAAVNGTPCAVGEWACLLRAPVGVMMKEDTRCFLLRFGLLLYISLSGISPHGFSFELFASFFLSQLHSV